MKKFTLNFAQQHNDCKSVPDKLKSMSSEAGTSVWNGADACMRVNKPQSMIDEWWAKLILMLCSLLLLYLPVSTQAKTIEYSSKEPIKAVLPFNNFGPSTRFISQSYVVPEGKRLIIEEVSVYIQLRETTDKPPRRAIAYLTTGVEEFGNNSRMSVHEPIGFLSWLDKSPPPYVGTTTGIIRQSMDSFTDHFVGVTFTTNESLRFTGAGSNPVSPVSHAVVNGYLVDIDAASEN